MKANPRSRATPVSALIALGLATTAALAGCVPPPPSAPAPQARPNAAAQQPRPQPRPTTAPQAAPVSDWRDAPQTPGDWTYSGSAASFGGGLFTVQCNPGKAGVTLIRSGVAAPSGTVALTIASSTGTRALNATATPRGVAVTVQPRDSVLDAMAFSRGRFAVAMTGQPTLYLPSWTEISRVIEDCR